MSPEAGPSGSHRAHSSARARRSVNWISVRNLNFGDVLRLRSLRGASSPQCPFAASVFSSSVAATHTAVLFAAIAILAISWPFEKIATQSRPTQPRARRMHEGANEREAVLALLRGDEQQRTIAAFQSTYIAERRQFCSRFGETSLQPTERRGKRGSRFLRVFQKRAKITTGCGGWSRARRARWAARPSGGSRTSCTQLSSRWYAGREEESIPTEFHIEF